MLMYSRAQCIGKQRILFATIGQDALHKEKWLYIGSKQVQDQLHIIHSEKPIEKIVGLS